MLIFMVVEAWQGKENFINTTGRNIWLLLAYRNANNNEGKMINEDAKYILNKSEINKKLSVPKGMKDRKKGKIRPIAIVQNFQEHMNDNADDEAVAEPFDMNIYKHSNMKKIASRFRAIRKAACFSQEDVGKILNVSYQQVQKYEAAMDRIPAVSLYLLSKTLGISVNEFFPESISTLANESINREIWMLARKLTAIKDPAVKKKLSSLVSCLEGI